MYTREYGHALPVCKSIALRVMMCSSLGPHTLTYACVYKQRAETQTQILSEKQQSQRGDQQAIWVRAEQS